MYIMYKHKYIKYKTKYVNMKMEHNGEEVAVGVNIPKGTGLKLIRSGQHLKGRELEFKKGEISFVKKGDTDPSYQTVLKVLVDGQDLYEETVTGNESKIEDVLAYYKENNCQPNDTVNFGGKETTFAEVLKGRI